MLKLLQRNTTPAASRILRPGQRSLPANAERYPVRGGGFVVTEVEPVTGSR